MFLRSRVPAFQGSRVPGFLSSRVPGYLGLGSRVYIGLDSKISGFLGSRVPGSVNSLIRFQCLFLEYIFNRFLNFRIHSPGILGVQDRPYFKVSGSMIS